MDAAECHVLYPRQPLSEEPYPPISGNGRTFSTIPGSVRWGEGPVQGYGSRPWGTRCGGVRLPLLPPRAAEPVTFAPIDSPWWGAGTPLGRPKVSEDDPLGIIEAYAQHLTAGRTFVDIGSRFGIKPDAARMRYRAALARLAAVAPDIAARYPKPARGRPPKSEKKGVLG